MNLTARKLEIFTTVAREGQVKRAAELLHLTQPAVSMALSDLESRHGGALFARHGRKLHLNDRGRRLLPLAEDILRRFRRLEAELEDSSPEPVGQLRVGASTTVGNYLLPALMARFSRNHPRASIQLHVGNSEQMVRALDQGSLDMALIEGPCHLPNLHQRFWRDDELVVIAGRDHPWAAAGRMGLKGLPEAVWIVREQGSGTREIFEQALGRKLTGLPNIVELGHTEAIKKAVEAGLGVGCLSRLAVQRELDQGWLKEIATPLALNRPLTVLLPDAGSPTRLQEACLAMLYSG